MIAILDYRAGNLTSVQRALNSFGFSSEITDSPRVVREADRIIFPGVGAAGESMANLRDLGLDVLLRDSFDSGKPILGICVGMQVLFDYSEENHTTCLGMLPGSVRLFPSGMKSGKGEHLKIPHMGWNEVSFCREHPVFKDVPPASEFYFVHSYYPDPAETAHVLGRTDYGLTFTSAVAHRNLVAVQFHPEKSGPAGLRVLKNFCRWNGRQPS